MQSMHSRTRTRLRKRKLPPVAAETAAAVSLVGVARALGAAQRPAAAAAVAVVGLPVATPNLDVALRSIVFLQCLGA